MSARDILGDWILDRDIPLRAGESVNKQSDQIVAALSAAGFVIVPRRERDEARAALAQARADALEEAAKQCDGWFVPVSTEADIAHNAALSHAGRRIRDLKSTPTQYR